MKCFPTLKRDSAMTSLAPTGKRAQTSLRRRVRVGNSTNFVTSATSSLNREEVAVSAISLSRSLGAAVHSGLEHPEQDRDLLFAGRTSRRISRYRLKTCT